MATDKVAGSTALKDAERLYREASAILSDAMAEAAAIALVIHDRWGDPLQTVCKRIADEAGVPDAWEALRGRARRQKPRSGDDLDGRARDRERQKKARAILHVEDREVKREVIREAMQADPDLAVAVQADASQVNRQPSVPPRTNKVKSLGFWASELLHIKEVRARLDSDRPSEETAGQLAEGWIGLAEAVSSLTLDEQLQSLIEGSR